MQLSHSERSLPHHFFSATVRIATAFKNEPMHAPKAKTKRVNIALGMIVGIKKPPPGIYGSPRRRPASFETFSLPPHWTDRASSLQINQLQIIACIISFWRAGKKYPTKNLSETTRSGLFPFKNSTLKHATRSKLSNKNPLVKPCALLVHALYF